MTVAVLSWGAHQTLTNTLKSYEKYGLDDDQKIIFFQDISNEDIEIAQRFGYQWLGSSQNIGIGPAYAELIRYAKGEFFLFLENDWELISPLEHEIDFAKKTLSTSAIDVVRFRSRQTPGYPLWTLQFKGNELSRPEHLLDACYWHDHPDEISSKIGCSPNRFDDTGVGDYHMTLARYANWTNNPTMFRTEWLREIILPWLEGDVEKNIQPWWQEQDFKVAQGKGLFTHNRID